MGGIRDDHQVSFSKRLLGEGLSSLRIADLLREFIQDNAFVLRDSEEGGRKGNMNETLLATTVQPDPGIRKRPHSGDQKRALKKLRLLLRLLLRLSLGQL